MEEKRKRPWFGWAGLLSFPGILRDRSILRKRILIFTVALVFLSLAGSTYSLFHVTSVDQSLDSMNRTSVPLSRLVVQLNSDGEILRREMNRRLGYSRWQDPHWKPQPIPTWIRDVLENEIQSLESLVSDEGDWASEESKEQWRAWVSNISSSYGRIKTLGAGLFSKLEQGDQNSAVQLYPDWLSSLESWKRLLRQGVMKSEANVRDTFAAAEGMTGSLRTGLQSLLVLVLVLSLCMLWLGERALRPLGELTQLARSIAQRGLRKEDKSNLPEFPVSRNDEVSQLAREFRAMATALLERETTVSNQQRRLEDQNRLLQEMGALNTNVLNSMQYSLIAMDLDGKISKLNPAAADFLGETPANILETRASDWKRLKRFIDQIEFAIDQGAKHSLEQVEQDGRVYGSTDMPLLDDTGKQLGRVLLIEDLTKQLDIEKRLRTAEHLAAVGRMSAQVAHEVRNPLHSIGLEAEIASERVAKSSDVVLKESMKTIAAGVDRLEKITDNYLKLSRLSKGSRTATTFTKIIESVLTTYSTLLESEGATVDWATGDAEEIYVDSELFEQVLGNLVKNSLQAMQGMKAKKIEISSGLLESGRVYLQLRDSGPGVQKDFESKLFAPFMTTKAQGTGLGLSFARKVLEDHGGEIRYEGNGSRGAVFVMTVPPHVVDPSLSLEEGSRSSPEELHV